MLKLRHFINLKNIYAHFEFDANNMFQNSCDRGSKRLEKLCNAKKCYEEWC